MAVKIKMVLANGVVRCLLRASPMLILPQELNHDWAVVVKPMTGEMISKRFPADSCDISIPITSPGITMEKSNKGLPEEKRMESSVCENDRPLRALSMMMVCMIHPPSAASEVTLLNDSSA